MSEKITYFTGAGASCYACPIWKQQGEKMLSLPKSQLGEALKFEGKNPYSKDLYEFMLWEIGYFGAKALEYGTIDSYARKLFLNNSIQELERLKLAVSVFFTIWQLTDDITLRKFDKTTQYGKIDNRYKSLFSSILKKSSSRNPVLNENIKFVTWNYDLQLEFTFRLFCDDNMNSFDDVSDNLKFRPKIHERLDICHLNGYHGFYETNQKENNFLERSEGKNIREIVEGIKFIADSHDKGTVTLQNHINYAWEDNEISKKVREEAVNIFAKTDILIIIGYSFPAFNKEIDKTLFAALNQDAVKIIYQDPNANEEILKVINPSFKNIICIKDKMDQFILPYDF